MTSGQFDPHFAAEAAELLEQLEILLDQPATPDANRMLRLASGVQNLARRAGADTVASVAQRLEDAARSILSDNIAWSDGIRALSAQTVGDLKLLVRAVHRWGPEEERRVRIAIERWDEHREEMGGGSADAVPIASLFFDDEGPHVFPVEGETPPAAGVGAERETRDETGHLPGEAPAGGWTEAELLGTAESESADDYDADDLPMLGGPSATGGMGTEHRPANRRSGALTPAQALREAIALRSLFERHGRGDAIPEKPLSDLVEELFELLEIVRSGSTTE